MEILVIFFAIWGAAHLWVRKRDIMNPGTLFLIYWAFVVFMAALRLYDLMETSQKAYAFVWVGVIFFYFGSYFADKITLKKVSRNWNYEVNYTFFYIAVTIVLLYSLYRVVFIVQLLASGNSWWEIRLMSTSGEGGSGTLKGGNLSDIIYSFVISPLVYLIVPTVIVEVFSGKKKKFPIYFAVIAVAFYSIATVSRAVWAFAILYVGAVVILFRKNIVLSRRQKRILKFAPLIVIVLALVINKITMMRNSEADIFANAYAYIAGCMPLLTIHLTESISSIRTYGMLTLYGFLNPIFFVTNFIHLFTYPTAFTNAKLVKDNLEPFFRLSPNITMNAYSTLFYDFYIDFGWIGIAVGSFIFAFICMKAFNVYKSRGDKKSLVLYLILLQFIFFSVARIYTIYATRALSLVWIIPMFMKVKKSEIK